MSFLWNAQAKDEASAVLPEKKRAAFALLGKLGVFFAALKLAPLLLDLAFPPQKAPQTSSSSSSVPAAFAPNPALAGLTPSPPSPSASV